MEDSTISNVPQTPETIDNSNQSVNSIVNQNVLDPIGYHAHTGTDGSPQVAYGDLLNKPTIPAIPVPIASGGTGQITATLGFDALAPTTTRGDLIARGASSNGRLAIGGANTVIHGGTDPAYSAVVEADITLADNTTNNVSTSKHGFVPKAPSDATKFLNGANPPAFTVPSLTITGPKISYNTWNMSTASGTLTTAHGFGSTPHWIKVHAYTALQNNSAGGISTGVYDGTNNNCIDVAINNGNGSAYQGAGYVVDLEETSSNLQRATATFDATNIVLTFTKSGTPAARDIQIMFESY